MVHIELAKAVELEGESIRVQMVEQGGLQAKNHRARHVLSLFLGRQGQSTLNSLRRFVLPLEGSGVRLAAVRIG